MSRAFGVPALAGPPEGGTPNMGAQSRWVHGPNESNECAKRNEAFHKPKRLLGEPARCGSQRPAREQTNGCPWRRCPRARKAFDEPLPPGETFAATLTKVK